MDSASSSRSPPVETQFLGASFGALPPIVGRSHLRPQIPRRKRTVREHIRNNFVVSTPLGTSTNDSAAAVVNVVRNSKKRKIYALEDSMAAETLIMMSQEDHRKMKKVEVKSDHVDQGYLLLPIKSVKDYIMFSMDERLCRSSNITGAAESKHLPIPLFSLPTRRKRTERKLKSNPVVVVSTKLEEEDHKMEAIHDDQQLLTAATTTPPPLQNSSKVVDWNIEKELFKSDVNDNSRLMLSKETVERDILASMDPDLAELCRSPAGAEFEVLDVDDSSSHRLRLKQHTNSSGSFVFVGQWKKKFVKRKALKVGDRIGLAWANDKFLLKLLNKKERKLN